MQELWQEVPHQTGSAAPVGVLFHHLAACSIVLFNCSNNEAAGSEKNQFGRNVGFT